ncbi:AfsR/SARP family transcriptional regulator [Kibdelosporangium aridum]|uniref:AfsR/SARP family transcriptional regulator n=1 Tax=Kibdelosporangium aridum TaxID=2030 RepID=A0A428Z320_KIBAR|nr:AfsR/SARP family transcriptional regulator [Kibdelosporangium aridum]RSM80359.1 AfsR/SARP family transcriptional regulator [Kibdelosporangium aridum]
MPIELTLLSTVAYHGQEVTAPRLRALLALLADDLRRGASIGTLIDGLWPAEQPENPAKAVHILVSRLRGQCGPDLVVSTPTGYRIALTEAEVDTEAILRSASDSAKALTTANYDTALAQAEAGLALWNGEGADGTDPLSLLRLKRTQAHQSLYRTHALALSKSGKHAEAKDPLEHLVTQHPQDEELILELMRTQAAIEGPAGALATYEGYRRRIRDELGTDPGPALQALHQRLLRGDTLKRGVAHEPNALLGRSEDIAAVTDLLTKSRVTSIIGPGGMGKTRLAHAVSREAEHHVYFASLAGVATDADVENEVASVLGEQRLTSLESALLVLDNCEHVLNGAAQLAQTLVSASKQLRILTTSRSPLGLSSETVYLLGELPLSTAIELFSQRARAARPGVDLPPDAVAELCDHLDGLPLAIELAAAKVRVMSVTEIASRLDDRFTLLRGGSRDAPTRHRTLHAVVDWSWNLLDDAGKQAMRVLSVFPAGFTYAAAEHVGVEQALEHLVDQSLLTAHDTAAGVRFQMLETVREFAAAQREDDHEIDLFLAWARNFCLTHYDLVFGPDPLGPLFRVDAEQDNLIMALRYGIERVDGPTVAATAAVLTGGWLLGSNYSRTMAFADEIAWVLTHYHPEPEYLEAKRTAATMCAVTTLMIQGPRALRSLVILKHMPPTKPDTLPKALAAFLTKRDSHEPLVAAAASFVESYVKESELDPHAALVAARQAHALVTDATPLPRMATHVRVADLYLQLGQHEEAEAHYLAALDIFDKDVTGVGISLILTNLHAGKLDGVEQWLDSVTDHGVENGTEGSFGVGVRAEILLARGEIEAGLAMWRRALDLINPHVGTQYRVGSSGIDPLLGEIQAAAVVAHAQHGRLDLVADLARRLPEKLAWLLANPTVNPSPFLREFPIWGALLLAVGMTEPHPGKAARMIALAERFHYLRGFQPTMSPARARAAVDKVAYAEAVPEYATLPLDQLRIAALDLLDR